MLSIAIRYLSGRAAAASVSNREVAEWPPHPGRLFMALVASWGGQGRSPEGQTCLEWLESLGSPHLSVPPADLPEAVSFFVPVNDAPGQKLLHETRAKKERHFPSAVPHRDTLYFIWPSAEASAEHQRAVSALCSGVTSLGRSSSLVQAWLEPSPPPANLVPVPTGPEMMLRVAAPGRLAQLEAAWKARRFPDTGPWQGYAAPTVLSEPVGSNVTAPDFLVLRSSAGSKLGLETTLQLTAAVRAAVLSFAGDDAPEVLSGHAPGGKPSQKPHLAFLPLPDVGHEHADGHLLGIAVVIPAGLSAGDREACLKAIAGLTESPVVMGRLGEWRLESVAPGEVTKRALEANIWTRRSARWATVTPIVLDRFPRSDGDAEETVALSCERAGLGRPRDVLVVPVSPILGTPHARGFPAEPARPGKPRRWHSHAIITFDSPIAGPVLLGAGRYRGYGLCRPLEGTKP